VDLALATAWPGALAAARDAAAAEAALVGAVHELGSFAAPAALRRRAVRLALEADPAAAFAPLPRAERCALGLARLGGATTGQIAEELGTTPAAAGRLLGTALRECCAPAA
jgi:DNA-directed RNA polymerase specialized sigma24 family protein